MSNNYTYPSLPSIVAGLKNPEIVESKFIYNFFMPDERVNEKSQILGRDGITDNAAFASRIGKSPRFVQIKMNQTWATTKYLDIQALVNAKAPILYEDAPFGRNFSSIVVQDTSADAKSYYIMSSSSDPLFTGELIVGGGVDSFGAFDSHDVVMPTESVSSTRMSSSTANERSFLFNALNNIQSTSYRYAKTDIVGVMQNDFLNDVKGFAPAVTFSNLFIGDITNRILENENSIFADEFAAALERSEKIQKKSRQSSNSYVVSADEYDLTLPYYDYELFDEADITSADLSVEVNHVGFVIDKSTQNSDRTVTINETTYLSSKETEYVDNAVRYGGLYSYTVRALYEVIVYAAAETSSSRGAQIAKAKMLFATSGKNIDIFCVENTPPPPPEDVYFKLLPEGHLFIGWQFPFNKQRDIKKFQVFRRSSLDVAFELISEIDFDDSVIKTPSSEFIPAQLVTRKKSPTCLYNDLEFNINSKFIYAIISVDAHGYTSNYSTQFQVSVDLFTESLVINVVVRKGCPKPYPNLYLEQDFFTDLVKDSEHKRMTVYFDPDYTDLLDSAGHRLNLIAFNSKRPSYKIHILETNLAQDQIVNITTGNTKIPVAIPISEAKVYTQVT